MTDSAPAGITIEREFAAAPADVFAAWTTAEHFARWFGGPAVGVPADRLDFAPVAGGTWSATMVLPDGNTIDWAGDFIEVSPDERFVFSLTDTPSAPERAKVTVDLAPAGEGTSLRFRQETPGFTDEQQQGLVAGWNAFLDELEAGLPSR